MLSVLSYWILLLTAASSLLSYAEGVWYNRREEEHRHAWWALEENLSPESLANGLKTLYGAAAGSPGAILPPLECPGPILSGGVSPDPLPSFYRTITVVCYNPVFSPC